MIVVIVVVVEVEVAVAVAIEIAMWLLTRERTIKDGEIMGLYRPP